MQLSLDTCEICPRACGVNRLAGTVGYCTQNATVRLARAALHMWEEPPISGERGSGTVFFSGCSLKCVYCQNHDISNGDIGLEVSIDRLAQIYLELQDKGAHNINLVSPSHFIPQIIESLDMARSKGLKLPIVYNTGGYESAESLKALRGYVDIFLTDYKYASNELAQRYSKASDYPEVAEAALDEMFAQTGPFEFDEEGMMTRGIIVRHLLLPGGLADSKHVMERLACKPYANDIIISLMSQYTPLAHVGEQFPELKRKVTEEDYDDLIDYALELGLEESYCQEGDPAEESFIPAFDYEGVLEP